MRKPLLLLLILGLSPIAYCASEEGADSNMLGHDALYASETFIQFYPIDAYVKVREYNLLSTLTSEEAMNTQVEMLKRQIEASTYCDERYSMEGFKSMQENLFLMEVGGQVVANIDCNLVTVSPMPTSMQAAFSSVLRRGVVVTGDRSNIMARFRQGDTAIRTNNAENIYVLEGDYIVIWRNGDRYFEMVFGQMDDTTMPGDTTGISSYTDRNISSPAMTQSAVQAWRDSQ